MSISIDLYKINYNDMVERIMNSNKKINNKELLEKILQEFGDVIGEQYVILDNEYWEDYNNAWNVTRAIQEVFKLTEDEWDDMDTAMWKERKNLNNGVDMYEVLDKLGIEY